MNAILKTMDEAFGGDTKASDEKLRARCLEQLDRCLRIIRELERPEFRSFVQFALAWRAMEHKLEEIQRMINDGSGKNAVHPFDELFAKLVKN